MIASTISENIQSLLCLCLQTLYYHYWINHIWKSLKINISWEWIFIEGPNNAKSFHHFHFSIKNSYSTLLFNIKNTYLSARNINAPVVLDNDGQSLIEAKNQFHFSIEQKFSEYWSFTTSSTFDNKNKIKFHDINAKVKYEDECLGFSFNWSRQYTHMPENPTSNSFLFLFTLKEIMENDI